VTTSAPDNLAQHLVARSAAGTVCAPSAQAIADSIQVVLTDPRGTQDEPAAQETWLNEHGWDFAADQVARTLGINMEGAPHVP